MSRKTVRIDLPTGSPDDFIVLGKAIKAKHDKDGPASPLDPKKMLALSAAIDVADKRNVSAKDADAQAQSDRQVRDKALGLADGQTVTTPDTVLNLVTYTRDQLVISNEGNEEALTAYGFNVVVGSAKNPTPKTNATTKI